MANTNPPIYRCTLCRDELIIGENYTIGYERFRKKQIVLWYLYNCNGFWIPNSCNSIVLKIPNL